MPFALLGLEVVEEWMQRAESLDARRQMAVFVEALINGPESVSSGSFKRPSKGHQLHYSHLRSARCVIAYWYVLAPLRFVRSMVTVTVRPGMPDVKRFVIPCVCVSDHACS